MAHVSLTPHLEEFIQAEVKTGRYSSPSEVMREALRLLEEEKLRRALTPEQERMIYDRLEKAKQGGPFVAHEDVEAYARARARGEKPERPRSFYA